jgi:hypothetical protein
MDPVAVRETVMKLWCELLEADEVGDDWDFVAAGGDSLLLVELGERLETLFPGTNFFDVQGFEWLTVRGMVDHILS